MAEIDFLDDSFTQFRSPLTTQPTQTTAPRPTTQPTWTTQQSGGGMLGFPSINDIAQRSGIQDAWMKQYTPQFQDLYSKYLGRSASNDELINWGRDFNTTWGGSLGNVERFLSNSDEARRYRTQQTTTPTGPSPFSGSGSFRDWFMGTVQGRPWNQQTLLELEEILGKSGSRLTPANAAGERTKIWDPTIQDWVRVGFGEGQPVWIPQGWGQNGPGFQSQFSDPSSAQLETFLQRYLGELDQQRGQQAGANADLRARQAQAQEATQRLIAFMQQRAQQLQGPAYTGAEQEVFRTQALDPIERDRQASHRRSLERTSARGMAPTSGLAELDAQNIDQSFDRLRAGSQNQLAYRQINEQRSREQEAQALLAAIPQTQRAAAQGDLGFLQALDAALNGYRDRGAQVATQQQQMGSLALRDALAAMGMAPSADNQFAQMMQMYQLQQQNSLPWWQALGSLLPMLG
jgi:hypothetical protein